MLIESTSTEQGKKEEDDDQDDDGHDERRAGQRKVADFVVLAVVSQEEEEKKKKNFTKGLRAPEHWCCNSPCWKPRPDATYSSSAGPPLSSFFPFRIQIYIASVKPDGRA